MAIFSWFRTILDGIATVLFRFVLRCFRLVFFMSPPKKQINPPIAALSSSPVHSTPLPSSSGSWKHDVFLSFRGTDTRNNFVDHLYSVLVQQGIYVYKDDQTLPRGETIGPSLLKAIEESQIALVIFSENYVDSSWCLQELEHIMRCKDENGLIVLPIFYHIDPSELRKQKGIYGAALAKHESENKNVESWRKALVDAGNLSGDVANGPETVVIKQIVGTISNRLCAPIPSDDVDLIGIEARLKELKSKMEMESDGVVMVGIWGVGGGGKTTLASALYDEISTRFDGSCFVKDVREESRKHGLPKLQKDILSIVLKLKTEEVVEDVGRLIKSRFRRKKVLMVLDDVDHADQLKELAGSNAWFGKGSRIIITTRDNHLLNARKVNVIYNISLLNDNEAIQLFCKHAPPPNRPIKEYEMVSKDVVSYAGGLPLVLEVLGSFLCDKDMSEWRSALARLRDIPDSDIMEKLKISYDGLKPMEKELFLDIACFFRGKEKDKAMEIFDACDYHPIIGIKVLIQKALIIVSKEGCFEMHDMIEEMGHYIVRRENPKNPELHSRVWRWEDYVKICGMDATKENDRIKALQVSFPWDKNVPPSIPHVVGNMKKLRWISVDEYSATPLPKEFQPMELCYLQLEYASLKQLWVGYKRNVIEDHFISIQASIPMRVSAQGTFTLQLPWNWYNEFSGFLLYFHTWDLKSEKVIIIKDEMGRENEDDVLEVSNKTVHDDKETIRAKIVCYISFGSLRNTSWWHSTHTTISFYIEKYVLLKVELVPRRNQDVDSIERSKDTTYLSEFWDEEHPDKKTFEIISDSKSSIEIQWRHNLHEGMFNDVM